MSKWLSDRNLTYKKLFLSLLIIALVFLGVAYFASHTGPLIFPSYPSDPAFNPDEHWEEITKNVPLQYQSRFYGAGSLKEALLLKAKIVQELEDQKILAAAGERGAIAKLIAVIFDFSSLLVLVAVFWIRSFWKLLLIALIAALLGEIVFAAFSAAYGGFEAVPYRITGHILVLILAYLLRGKVAKKWSPPTLKSDI